MSEAAPKKSVNPFLKAYVLFHMAVILSWALPKPAPAIANGASHFSDFMLAWNEEWKYKSPTKYYLLSTGLWQYWDMFSPNPSNLDIWWDSIVTYRSGKEAVVPYPRM